MNRHTLPRALFTALVAGAAAAQPAVALPPLRAELVDELTLSQVSGKYFGANMLVGLRIDVTSTLHTAQQGGASASGTLSIRRVGSGYEVRVDSRSAASAGGTGATVGASNGSATGADALQVNGIGQISQIAGDGNRMANVTTIRFLSDAAGGASPDTFNGQTSSSAVAGPMSAQVNFLDGGVDLRLSGPGTTLSQQFRSGGGSGQILQMGQIAGDGVVGSNQLQLQVLTSAMTTRVQHQLGIQQALAGLGALGR